MNITLLSHASVKQTLRLPHFVTPVNAGATGFPSPAEDYMDKGLDLNEHLIKHPAATFYGRASGHSMRDIGILDGDLLICDRAVKATHGQVVIAVVDGELVCKVLDLHNRRLLSANNQYPPIPISEDMDLVIEGVVISSVRYHHVCSG